MDHKLEGEQAREKRKSLKERAGKTDRENFKQQPAQRERERQRERDKERERERETELQQEQRKRARRVTPGPSEAGKQGAPARFITRLIFEWYRRNPGRPMPARFCAPTNTVKNLSQIPCTSQPPREKWNDEHHGWGHRSFGKGPAKVVPAA